MYSFEHPFGGLAEVSYRRQNHGGVQPIAALLGSSKLRFL